MPLPFCTKRVLFKMEVVYIGLFDTGEKKCSKSKFCIDSREESGEDSGCPGNHDGKCPFEKDK